jgi:cyclohexadienyl dehydratase
MVIGTVFWAISLQSHKFHRIGILLMESVRPVRRWVVGVLMALMLPVAASVPAQAALTAAQAQPPRANLQESRDLVSQVLQLVDQRLALMPDVALAKWRQAQQPIADPAREAAVIAAAADRAALQGLEREPIAKLFELQIRLARERQETLYILWRATPPDEQMPVRSLAQDLRPAIDGLTTRIIAALYLAAPMFAGNGAGHDELAELARRTLPPERWREADRALLLEVLESIRYGAARSVDRARAAQVLRIGTPADYAPFSLAIDGHLQGSDVQLALQLAASLQLDPVFIRTAWKRLGDDLAADRFDIAIGGISVTPARLAVAAFSLPVAHSGKTAIGRCRDRSKYRSFATIDAPSVRVIENTGGTNESFARSHLARASLVMHPDNTTVFEELLAHRADVMFSDDTEIALASHRHPQLCRLLTELYEPADKAWMLPRDGAWLEAVNAWLQPELARQVPQQLLREALGASE